MYKDINESSKAEDHSQLLDMINERALEERIISNTFMNTQNNDTSDKSNEESTANQNNPENERKMMIEQLKKSTKKTLKFVKLPPSRQKNDAYVLQNKNDLIIKAVAAQMKTQIDLSSDSKIEKINLHY